MVIVLIFSKDRAMQLDATLRSMHLHCQDTKNIKINVLYITSDPFYEEQYMQLINEYDSVEFIKENNFKSQVISSFEGYEYVLFLVDDNIFVQNFLIKEITGYLKNNPDALGFSLRLGANTTYCYPLDCKQKIPDFRMIGGNVLKYNWITAQHDFGYPLELSSTTYRTSDILTLLSQVHFTNPNTLEAQMNANKWIYINDKRYLIYKTNSIAFCNPVNVVQNTYDNRAGNKVIYSIDKLGQLFEKGYRIDVEKYSGFIPNACHQEVEFEFKKP